MYCTYQDYDKTHQKIIASRNRNNVLRNKLTILTKSDFLELYTENTENEISIKNEKNRTSKKEYNYRYLVFDNVKVQQNSPLPNTYKVKITKNTTGFGKVVIEIKGGNLNHLHHIN